MRLKPDIDFAELIATGQMAEATLRQTFGGSLDRNDLEYAKRQFRRKHYELWPLLLRSRLSLRLMTEEEAVRYNLAMVHRSIAALMTIRRRHAATPTASLPSDLRKQHESAVRAGENLGRALEPAAKSLPRLGER